MSAFTITQMEEATFNTLCVLCTTPYPSFHAKRMRPIYSKKSLLANAHGNDVKCQKSFKKTTTREGVKKQKKRRKIARKTKNMDGKGAGNSGVVEIETFAKSTFSISFLPRDFFPCQNRNSFPCIPDFPPRFPPRILCRLIHTTSTSTAFTGCSDLTASS